MYEVMSLLKEEFRQSMVLSGVTNISNINSDLVVKRADALFIAKL